MSLDDRSSQVTTFKVEVQESRNFLSKNKAVFEVALKAIVSDAVLYVAEEDGDGWVVTRPERGTKDISLPYHLKVALERQDDKRQYFEVREGIMEGMKASVKIDSDGTSHLSVENPQKGSAYLIYSLSKQTLKLNRSVYTVLPFTDDPEPWKKGLYDIEIPDAPHEGGATYVDRARLAKVWFRVGHSGERYLHTGRVTLGCLTLTEIKRWDDLCKALMKARKGDGKSVGVLEITD